MTDRLTLSLGHSLTGTCSLIDLLTDLDRLTNWVTDLLIDEPTETHSLTCLATYPTYR